MPDLRELLAHAIMPSQIKMRWLSEYFHANYPDSRAISN